jgi:vacuolar protein sorting-associated protein 45
MDPRASVADYISRMINSVAGVKAFLVDDETTRILGVAQSQSTLLERDVFLIDHLKTNRSADMVHIAAIVFVRPTAENVRLLRTELRRASFGSYHIFFTNFVRATYLEEIADSDESCLVTQVGEYFADFVALDSSLFSFNVSPCLDATLGAGASAANPYFERTVDGILALLLALKRRPFIHYQGSSSICRNLAERVSVRMEQEAGLFGFRSQEVPTMLLLLDRREDPVTPLLNQWTYEAMVHELIGVKNNRVSLQEAPNVPDDLREVVLDPAADDFYLRNRFENFGALGINLKVLVDGFSSQTRSHSDLSSIEAMMHFVGSYPEFRKTMANVSKHVALSSELSRQVEKGSLLEVSQLEQDLACREAEGEHRRRLLDALANPKVAQSDKLRLVMLYSLRYEESPQIRNALDALVTALRKAGIGPNGLQLISDLKRYAGAEKRSGDIFSNRSFFALASNTVRRGIGGVDNVYTQHEPLLAYTLDDLLRGRAKTSQFPSLLSDDFRAGDGYGGAVSDVIADPRLEANGPKPASTLIRPPREVIVFIAGGVTYEESKCVSGINGGPHSFKPLEGSTTASAAAAAKLSKTRIVLGGSCVTNSTLFAVEISKNASLATKAESSRAERSF